MSSSITMNERIFENVKPNEYIDKRITLLFFNFLHYYNIRINALTDTTRTLLSVRILFFTDKIQHFQEIHFFLKMIKKIDTVDFTLSISSFECDEIVAE